MMTPSGSPAGGGPAGSPAGRGPDVSPRPTTRSLYRAWPTYVAPEEAAGLGAGGALARDIFSCWVIVLPFLIPAVRSATGISVGEVCFICTVFTGWSLLAFWFHRLTDRALAFHLVVAGYLVINISLALAFPVFSGEPATPLWAFAAIYACINACAAEYGPCWIILAAHVLMPLLTIPLFLAQGAHTGWSIAGPAIASVASFIGYHCIANHTATNLTLRDERDQARERVRQLEAERQNRVLARELHDSVGSALSLAAMYGEIFARGKEGAETAKLAEGLRESARTALTDLRSVLGAVAPSGASISALAASLQELATRIEGASDVRVTVDAPESNRALSGAARLALVRVFQEATQNALRHAGARNIGVALALDGGTMRFVVEDDGRGFDVGGAKAGRGLANMKQRAHDLGGELRVEPRADGGTVVTMQVPLDGILDANAPPPS